MRGVRFTAGEQQLLNELLSPTPVLAIKLGTPAMRQKYATSIRNKLAKANEAGISVSIQPLERALIESAGHKVVPLLNGYERASRQAGSLLITVDDCHLVGTWMLSQQWLNGKFTILDVLNKWSSWYAKAISERDSKRPVKKGIGNEPKASTTDTRPNIDESSTQPTIRRSSQGFR